MERERDNRTPRLGQKHQSPAWFVACLGYWGIGTECEWNATCQKSNAASQHAQSRLLWQSGQRAGASRHKQARGGSRCSVERFGVMLSRGARWNQLWGDLGRFIAVQALPSPVIRKLTHLARAALPRLLFTPLTSEFLGCGEARLAECECGGGCKPGADRRHLMENSKSLRFRCFHCTSLQFAKTKHKSKSDGKISCHTYYIPATGNSDFGHG